MTRKSFLVAIDQTDEAAEVLDAGCELAERFDGELTVMTVVRPLSFVYGDMATGAIMAQYANLEADTLKQAEEALHALARDRDIPIERCVTVLGYPANEIRRYAANVGVDTIVIGTHGRHGLGLLLGSTANAVLHGAPCDVMVVRIRTDSEPTT